MGWAQLPGGVVHAVGEKLTVPYTAVDAQHAAASGVAALLTLPSGAMVFVKGQRERDLSGPVPATAADDTTWWGPDWSPVDELDLEEAINPYLPTSAPRVLWRIHAHGWYLLAFEGLVGRDAEYTPGSPDLQPVAEALAELAAVTAPSAVRLPTAWDRWGYYCTTADQERLTGTGLLHTDPASTNIIMGSGRAHFVDWSWPAVGLPWMDTALWGMRLVSTGGHTPEQAWDWAAHVAGWDTADPRALVAFTRAEARRWHDLAVDQVPSAASISEAADAWADAVAGRS
ncbi:aminoglycoside phosphotransferase [Streptomyces sp. G-G2]|uniref:aminoglycoside phosphotransferase n=1 Tax=Streptomyces sp. G-G2 TaxID=3046201 RepID=UPI0024B8A687|nr:aminoglycoside phosphotransferase [Streptomyces sp. G-G2]MDJ0382405.1 aminoglycoside phosphotransferase [Streptomyces sp. G-G2]